MKKSLIYVIAHAFIITEEDEDFQYDIFNKNEEMTIKRWIW